MKIGLLGGSFNPPHKGHLYISNLAIKKLGLNQVWWLPTKQNPFKEKSLYEGYFQRFSKCVSITKNSPKIYVKKYDEISTEKLVSFIKNRHKNYEFIWLMGADGVKELHRWNNFKKLVQKIPFAIFSRENFFKEIRKSKAFLAFKRTTNKFTIFATKNLNISSTKLRSEK